MKLDPVTPETATGGVWRCLYCPGMLRSGDAVFRCDGCGKHYPVVAGIPLLVREAANYFRGQRAALLGVARDARRRRELLDQEEDVARWTEASLARRRDVAKAEAAQAEALLAVIGMPGSRAGLDGASDEAHAVRPGWAFETMMPYLLRDWSGAPELRDTAFRIGGAVRRAFPDPRGRSVVFSGCGAAGLLAEMPAGFARLVGFDLTLPILAAARRLLDGATLELPLPRVLNGAGRVTLRRRDPRRGKPPVELVAMDVLETAFPDGAVDCVVTAFLTDILPDPLALAAEVHRILSDDGVWINYGPSGNDPKAHWRFDETEGAAFFGAVGFEVIAVEARRGTNLDISGVCPSVSFRNVVCYLTAARKAGRPAPRRGATPPGPGEVASVVPRHFPGARLTHLLEMAEDAKMLFQHEGVVGRGESWQVGGRAARALILVDGRRTVSDIASLLSRRNPPHPVEETLRVFAGFFEKGLLNWRDGARDPR